MWERDQKTDSRSDGRSDHAASGTDEDPAAGTGGAGQKGRRIKSCWTASSSSGYVRVQIDGSVYELTEEISLDKNKKHNIEDGG